MSKQCINVAIGKTTALQIALSLYGAVEENGNSQKTSASSLLLQTGLGTLPIGEKFVELSLWAIQFCLYFDSVRFLCFIYTSHIYNV